MAATKKAKRKSPKKNRKQPRSVSGSKHRPSWRGMLRFGLVSVPVQAFNAHLPDREVVAFHQLHATCHSRIHYQKVCPIHGEVSNDEIVSGYEYAKGKYVEIDPDELDKFRPAKDRALNIDAFIAPDELDPIYFDGRMYYLAPEGNEAAQPYAVLLQALERQDRWGVGQVIFSGKEQLVVVRPDKGALQMAMLHHADAVQKPAALVGNLPRVRADDKTAELVESWTDKNFDFSRYVDRYGEEVRKLIEAKVHGHKLVAPEEPEEEPAVYNLMDALRKSMDKNHRTGEANGKKHRRRTKAKPHAARRRAS